MRAERDALAHEVEQLKAPRKRRLRRGIVGVLVALSCLLVVLSTTVVWAHRTVLNTETFVGTVGPGLSASRTWTRRLPSGPRTSCSRGLHLEARSARPLPPRVSFAAGPITDATEGYVVRPGGQGSGVRAVPDHLDPHAHLHP